MPSPPKIEIEQRVEWVDTDASGHHHHASIVRMAERAEAELMERLGLLEELYGSFPRVHVSVDLLGPLAFRERVTVALEVAALGRSSVTFGFRARSGARSVAQGRIVAVQLGGDGRAAPWSARQRSILSQTPGS